MRSLTRLLPLAPLAALATAIAVVDVGLFAFSPGPARDVISLIDVDGHATYRPDGALLLTTVNVGRVDALRALRGWLDPSVDVVPEHEVIPRGQTGEEYNRVSRSQMDESKIAAVVFALERLTDYPEEHGPGALVQSVEPGSAAEDRLFPGDLIVAVGQEPLDGAEQLSEAIRATQGHRRLTLTVEAGGEERTVAVRPRFDPGERRPILGVYLVENFPFDVVIESGDIGGPSAGLMWALGVYDLLSPRDLLGGRRVAGTGEVTSDGRVGPIGGIEQKVVAAERADADIFLVPEGNLEDAQEVAGDIRLVPVRTVDQAIRALERTAA